jgi:hypothetical protein
MGIGISHPSSAKCLITYITFLLLAIGNHGSTGKILANRPQQYACASSLLGRSVAKGQRRSPKQCR